jgi:2-polyprenyl-3-methyl-5-hydroxy-6-metoxy-1,4-benzoquinol methylase
MRSSQRVLHSSVERLVGLNPEVEKFRALSSQWWDVRGPLKTLHELNPSRVSYINRMIRQSGMFGGLGLEGAAQSVSGNAGCRILDVGCGGGILSESLARRGATVTGLDENALGIQVAEARRANFMGSGEEWTARLQYAARSLTSEVAAVRGSSGTPDAVAESAASSPSTSAKCSAVGYDVVVASEVLEHVDHPKQFLTDLALCAKDDGGLIILSTLNKTVLCGLVYVLMAENLTGMVPKGTHDWAKFLPVEDVTRVMAGLGVDCVNTAAVYPRPSLLKSSLWPLDLGLEFSIEDHSSPPMHYFWTGRKRLRV